MSRLILFNKPYLVLCQFTDVAPKRLTPPSARAAFCAFGRVRILQKNYIPWSKIERFCS